MTRRFILAGLGATLVPAGAIAKAPLTSLRPRLRGSQRPRKGPDSLIAAAGLSGAVACAVADVKTGRVLEGEGAETGLPPASVAKSLTALYALDSLGAGYRFRTEIIANGPIENGILKGDLILAGGGDPTLDTEALARLAANLKATGLREVRGKFKVYDGLLPYVKSIDAGQPDHLGYSPAVSGISLNFNRVHFEWKRGTKGYSVSMDARSANYRPDVAMATMKVVKRGLPVYTYKGSPRQDNWTVASKALGKGGARWLPVRKPALYAGDVFQTIARSHGIVLGKVVVTRSKPSGTVLTSVQSAELNDILRGMLKYSTNVTAEMVGMTASVARGEKLNSLKDSGRAMSSWAARKYGMTGTSMVDHSGLGDASRMVPADLVRALVKSKETDVLKPILKPFALKDSKGRPVKSHPIRVAAKTGTLNFVSCLGGFLTAPDGTEMAFAIFTADMKRRSKISRANRERAEGAREWNRRSRKLQQKLIERWGTLYGS